VAFVAFRRPGQSEYRDFDTPVVMSPPSIDTLADFKSFLHAYVSTVLYLRSIYRPEIFAKVRFHNTPVFQSRSPELRDWINDAIEAVHRQLHRSKVGTIGFVIFAKEDGQVMERYMFDVSAFPVMESSVLAEIERDPLSPISPVSVDATDSSAPYPETLRTMKPGPLDEDTPVDLSEQLRATLIRLVQRCELLKPLATQCSLHVSMEMKSDSDAESLTRGSLPWISVPSWETEQGSTYADEVAEGVTDHVADDVTNSQEKNMAICSVRYPHISFDTWVEIFSSQAESGVGSRPSPLFPRSVK
jgi:mitotic spindle assembly checkpoint protein MAD2B